ncbi:hypothetical protein NTE_00503 [Candidatus Nitrososphaera evergladensis SR1]|uniref:Phage protein D n=1 Tax=Candidatus Nitrososphaera evergladensis SR1 TaxID=1459636 RepID=A0A075MTF8_9ARCH|nr:hypothetical protein [Candidatus Nitrososphaera evergladensis]AIF82584.1 hypothetical protein NTE_00503 [Candidatus Nitrososphaera evergladensis SR1]
MEGLTNVYVILMAGPTIPTPVPEAVASAVESIEVTNRDIAPDGFEIIFNVGRSRQDLQDYALIANPLLNPFNQVRIIVTFGGIQTNLINGIITTKQLSPSQQPGQTRMVVTGEDLSFFMSKDESPTTHSSLDDKSIVEKIIAKYTQHGIEPDIHEVQSPVRHPEADQVPSQQSTDLDHIKDLARKYNYVFFLEPALLTNKSRAYWGPRKYTGAPQKALTLDMGSESNLKAISFQYNVTEPTIVTGKTVDIVTNKEVPVTVTGSSLPPLSLYPVLSMQASRVQKKKYNRSSASAAQAMSEAQAETDESTDAVIATGTLDSLAYGGVLQARKLVGLRGVGFLHDGYYYVKEVKHEIKKGEYKQSFKLVRDGLGSTASVLST